ncbi:MAG: carbon monoxide dehydrogenase subunit G [Rubrivivax sp.]|nr:carbon monoxide dehydrogenase subunit G [Rubrivivax sp.]
MDFTGEYRIPAAPQRVWDALVDPEVLKTCITGCRELNKVSDTEFAAVVVAKVGPVSATFKGQVALLDVDPPHGYTISGQGQGGAAGFAKMKARVALAEDGEGTLLSYEAHAEVGGKLAAVGSRLVQSVAKKNADEFFTAFAARLGGAAVAPPPAAAAAAVPAPIGTPAEAPAAPSAAAAPWPAPAVPSLPVWVIALIAGGCGVVLGFVLGRL